MDPKTWPTTSSVRASSRQLGKTLSLPAPSIGAREGTQETQKNSKRKSTFDESTEVPRKRSTGTPSPSAGPSSPSASTGVDAEASTPVEPEGRKSSKRKSPFDESTEVPRKRSRGTPSPSTPVEPEGWKKSKRKSTFDENIEIPRKKSTGTPSPSAGPSSPSASAGVDAEASTPVEPEGRKSSKRKSPFDESTEVPRKRSRGTPSPSTPVEPEGWKNSKRKSTFDENTEVPRKRSRGTPSPSAGPSSPSASASVDVKASTPVEAEGRKSSKRKSEEREEEPRKRSRKRSRKTTTSSKGTSHPTTDSSNKPGTSSSVNTAPPHSRGAFETKYKEEQLLGAGGFGSVCAGYRRDDNLPVAIKHIPGNDIMRTATTLDGNDCLIPLEVALLLKVKPAAGETSAVIALLDWYDLDFELILVLERPVPCLDLIDYINTKGSCLQEYEARNIAKQLVDALIEVHSKGVFHRDIKLDNILIETSSDVPRVRLIDFGCGTFLSEGRYSTVLGTYEYITPELFQRGWYRAEPTTVWQLGVVVFALLHKCLPFRDRTEVIHRDPNISDDLSFDCQGFILSCLVKSPEARATLETLRHHPWLE